MDVLNPATSSVTRVHVMVDGCDDSDGFSRMSDGSGSGPLRTLSGARDLLRRLREAGESGPFVVEIGGGIHVMDETFVLRSRDSGTAQAPVTYRAVPGEQPVLSGGVRIEGFVAEMFNGRTVWRASLPRPLDFDQLYVNGYRANRPRSDLKPVIDCGAPASGDLDWHQHVDHFVFADGDIDPTWTNLQDVEIIVPKLWFESHTRIDRVDASTCTVHLDRPVLGGVANHHGGYPQYWIENVFEWLAQPGEFYLDKKNCELFYVPRFGDRLDDAIVVAPQLDTLVQVQGDVAGEKVRHVRFEGLTFQHAHFSYPEGYPGGVQAAYTVPGAVVLRGAEDILMRGCEVSQVDSYAVEFGLGCSRNTISGCRFHDLGGGGVRINHERGSRTPVHEEAVDVPDWRADLHVPDGVASDQLPMQQVTVADCEIFEGCKKFHSAVGIWIGDAGGNRILHNEIHHMNYSGISCGWAWVFDYDRRAADNCIEGNYIHHLNQQALLSDLAGIYMLGPSPGTMVRGNLIHDVRCAVYGNWGIYLDGSTSFVRVERNMAYRCGYGAMFSNVGRANLAQRNILINDVSPDNPAMVVGDDSGMLCITARQNILISSMSPQVLLKDGYAGHVEFEGNVYGNPFGLFGFASREDAMLTLSQWLEAGYGHDESTTCTIISGSESGRLSVPDDAQFIDEAWRQIVDDLRHCGPRSVPPPLDQQPSKHLDDAAIAIMPVLELSVPLLNEDRRNFVERVTVVPGESIEGHWRLVNHGRVLVRGGVRLGLEPPSAGTFDSGGEKRYVELAPGASEELSFKVRLNAQVPRVVLRVIPDDERWMTPTAVYLYDATNLQQA